MPEISRKNLTTESFWSLLSAVVISFSSILYIVIIGNWWGSNGLGIFSLCISLYLIGSVVCNLGINGAVLYEVAASGEDEKRASSFIYTAILSSLFLGVLSGAAGFILASLIAAAFRQPQMTGMVRLFSFALPLFLVNKTVVGILNAHRRMRLIAGVDISRAVIITLYLVGSTVLKVGIVSIVYGFILAELAISASLLVVCLRIHRFVVPSVQRAKRLLSFGWKMAFSGVVTSVNSRLDILVIGIFCEASVVGIYSIASAIAKGLWLVPVAIQRVTNPLIVQLYLSGEKEKLYRTIDVLLRLGTFLFVIIGLIIVIYIKPLLSLLYPARTEMLGAVIPLYFLIPGAVIYSGIGMIGTAPASSIGRPENALKQILIIFGANILMNFTLVPFFAAAGAASATTISLLVALTYFSYLCKEYLDFAVPLTRLFLLFFVFCLLIVSVTAFESVVSHLILLVTGLIVIIATLTTLGMVRKSDWNLIRSVLKSFTKPEKQPVV